MDTTKLLTLSDVRVISPPQVHPYAEEAERIIEHYCEQLGIKSPNFHEFTTMGAYVFPRTSVERLVAMDILTNWLYYIDDVWDRNTEQGKNLDPIFKRKVFETCFKAMLYGVEPDHEHEFYPTCLELHRQFMELADQEWLERLGTSLIPHLKSSTYSIEDIEKSGKDLVEEYIKLRELDAGTQVTISLIEFSYDMRLPDFVLEHPDIQKMGLCTALSGGIVNDMFSYEKEVMRYGADFNYISVVMRSRNVSFREAVHECVMLVNDYIDTFVELEKNPPRWDDDRVNQLVDNYIEGLRDQIIAGYHWQLATNRYRSPNSPFPELREML